MHLLWAGIYYDVIEVHYVKLAIPYFDLKKWWKDLVRLRARWVLQRSIDLFGVMPAEAIQVKNSSWRRRRTESSATGQCHWGQLMILNYGWEYITLESEGEERSEATGHSRNGQSETSEEWARNEAHGDEANVDSGRYAKPDSEPSLSGEGPDFVPGPFSAIIQRLTREAAQQGEGRPEQVVRDPLTYPPIQEDEMQGVYPRAGVDLTPYSSYERVTRMIECYKARLVECEYHNDPEEYENILREIESFGWWCEAKRDGKPISWSMTWRSQLELKNVKFQHGSVACVAGTVRSKPTKFHQVVAMYSA